MPSSGLSGPYPLTLTGVDQAVTYKSPGTYALGRTNENKVFEIFYVGRADDDVNARLHDHTPKWYPQFKFGYFTSAKAAFEKECRLYHDFNPPDNTVHPARPTGAKYSCPCCGVFDY